MVQITLHLTEEFAQKVEPFSKWLPTILELSLVGFRTQTTQTATEIIEFLSSDPLPQDMLNYHISERAQERLQRLLALNEAALLGPQEQLELDEIEKIEHIMVMLKAQIAGQHTNN